MGMETQEAITVWGAFAVGGDDGRVVSHLAARVFGEDSAALQSAWKRSRHF